MISVGVVVAAVVGVLVVAFWPEPKEPEYHGKKLSEWVRDMDYRNRAETAEALRAIGPEKAVLFFVKWMPYRASRWRQRVSEFYWMHRKLPLERFASAQQQRNSVGFAKARASVRGFVVLGERASNAIPALTHIAYGADSPAAERAVTSLSYLGKGAIDPLIKLGVDPALPPDRRSFVLRAMAHMTYLGTNAAPCLDVLAREASTTNRETAAAALTALGIFTYPTELPINVDMGYLRNAMPDPLLRQLAMRTAIAIATNSVATNSDPFAYDFISRGTNDPDPAVRAEVVRYLDGRKRYLGGSKPNFDATAKHE
jgi:hypothetical protein